MADELKRMIQRADTTENWDSFDPVLRAGELGVDTSTNEMKLGDGSASWSELPPIPSRATSAQSVVATLHNDNQSDAGPYLTDLSAQAAAAGVWLVLDGVYRCDTRWGIAAGAKIDATRAVIIKNFDSATSSLGLALVGGANSPAKTNDVTIVGGEWKTAAVTGPDRKRGSIFGIYGDNWTLSECRITAWTKGRAIDSLGDDTFGFRIVATGSLPQPGDGGWRVLGGKRGRAIGCRIESGDDVFQFVPSGGGATANPQWFSQSISDWYFIACTGKCTGPARLLNASLQNRDTTADMTASITDCGWINVNGEGGTSLAVLIANFNSTGDLDCIRVTDCAVTGRSTGTAEVSVAHYAEGPTPGSPGYPAAGIGRVRDIRFTNFRLHNPKRTSLSVRGKVEGLSFFNSDLEAPQPASNLGVAVNAGSPLIVAPTVLDDEGYPLPPPWGVETVAGAITAPGLFPAGTVVKAVSSDGYTITAGDTAGNDVNALASNANATIQIGGTRTILLRGVTNFRYIGGSVQGGGNGHTIFAGANDIVGTAGTSPGRVTDARIDTRIYDVPNNYVGLNFNRVTNGRATFCTIIGKAGETSATGVRVAADSTECSIRNNNLLGIATVANRLSDVATDTDKGSNRGVVDTGVGAKLRMELTADSNPANNTGGTGATPQDSLLTTTIPAGEWEIEAALYYDADAAVDLAVRMQCPADATGYWCADALANTATAANGQIGRQRTTLGAYATLGGAGVGTTVVALPRGKFKTTTGGTFLVKYAQPSATPGNTDSRLREGSYVILTRVA